MALMAPSLRWQPAVVALALAAPPVGLAVAVWPDSPGGGAAGTSTDPVPIGTSDQADGSINFQGVAVFEITADDDVTVRVDVLGGGSDPTLTIVDDDGDQLGFNDDTDGLDPQVVVDLAAGDVVRAEVRSFSGDPMAFTIRTATDDAAGGSTGDEVGTSSSGSGSAGGGSTAVPVPSPAGVPGTIAPTTVAAEG